MRGGSYQVGGFKDAKGYRCIVSDFIGVLIGRYGTGASFPISNAYSNAEALALADSNTGTTDLALS